MESDKTAIKDHLSDLGGKHSHDDMTEEEVEKGKGVLAVNDLSEGWVDAFFIF